MVSLTGRKLDSRVPVRCHILTLLGALRFWEEQLTRRYDLAVEFPPAISCRFTEASQRFHISAREMSKTPDVVDHSFSLPVCSNTVYC